ncbi:hypothetical protein LY78DRAFT_741114 [Colletotrichum sublineola]|uniref:Uncharacterized protein n=1 Tax=Colletotrichum sublineola TaxID=1173701 RepID=A0A066XHF2_COLSU|nr:hypothetical protein LY78DRAFT_741114 [Colletotrichum sublineola]KDN68608.1 hypothetical protein CSUB01_10481 [Colletotrichum sublineola]
MVDRETDREAAARRKAIFERAQRRAQRHNRNGGGARAGDTPPPPPPHPPRGSSRASDRNSGHRVPPPSSDSPNIINTIIRKAPLRKLRRYILRPLWRLRLPLFVLAVFALTIQAATTYVTVNYPTATRILFLALGMHSANDARAPLESGPTTSIAIGTIFRHGTDITYGTNSIADYAWTDDTRRIVNEASVRSGLTTRQNWDEYWSAVKGLEAKIEVADSEFQSVVEEAFTSAHAAVLKLLDAMGHHPAAAQAQKSATWISGVGERWRQYWRGEKLTPTQTLVKLRLQAFEIVLRRLVQPMEIAERAVYQSAIDRAALKDVLCALSEMLSGAVELGEWYLARAPKIDTGAANGDGNRNELGPATLELRQWSAVGSGLCRQADRSRMSLGAKQEDMREWARRREKAMQAVEALWVELLTDDTTGEGIDQVAVGIEGELLKLVDRLSHDLRTVYS